MVKRKGMMMLVEKKDVDIVGDNEGVMMR